MILKRDESLFIAGKSQYIVNLILMGAELTIDQERRCGHDTLRWKL